jgi:hypothetical protein
MIDRTTKIILAAIALGLWANASVSVLRPAKAGDRDLLLVTDNLLLVNDNLSRLMKSVATVGVSVFSIELGSCSNKKIC